MPLPEIIRNPSMSDIAMIWKAAGQGGRDGSVRFVKSPDGDIYAFDGTNATHDQVIRSFGADNGWGRGENVDTRQPIPRGGEWVYRQVRDV